MEVKNARKIFTVVFGLTAIVTVAWWLYLQLSEEREAAMNYWFNFVYGLSFLFAGVWLSVRAWSWRRQRSPDTVVMLFLALSFLMYAAAQFIWTYYNLSLAVEIPTPSIPDYFYVSSSLLQILAFVLLLFHTVRKRPLARSLTALLVLAAVVGSVFFTSILFEFAGSGEGVLFNLDTFYTSSSIIIVYVILLNIHRRWHEELRPFLFTNFLAAAANGFGNLLFAIRVNNETYWNGDMSDGLYALSAALFFLSVGLVPKTMTHAVAVGRKSILRIEHLLPGAMIIFGILLGAMAADYTYRNETNQLQLETQAETSKTARLVQQTLSTQAHFVTAIRGFFLGSQVVTEQEFYTFVGELERSDSEVSNFAFLDSTGRVLWSQDPSMIGYDFAADSFRVSYLTLARQGEQMVVSEPLILLSGEAGVLLLQPIRRDGTYIGTLVNAIDLAKVVVPIFATLEPDTFDYVLSTHESIISVEDGTVHDRLGRKIVGGRAVVEAERTFVFPETGPVAATESILIGNEEWLLTVSPGQLSYQDMYVSALLAFLSIVVVIVSFAAVVYLVLTQHTHLQDELDRKTQALQEKIRELAQSKFFLDHVSDAVLVADASRRIIYANQAVGTIFAFGTDKLIGEESLAFLGRSAAAFGNFEEALEQRDVFEGEVPFQRKNGTTGDLLLSAIALRDQDGRRIGTLMVGRDITDRKATERAKTQFVSLVSHQLRAPMTQLRWMAEQLLEQSRMPKPVREQLQSMADIIMRENKLVGDLLNVSRIERGVLKLDIANVSLPSVIDETIRPLQKLAADKHVTIHVGQIPEVLVRVDQDKAAEALRNIIDNAIKFSPASGEVNVRAEVKNGDAVVFVSDEGPGIPEELWDTLFDIKTKVSTDPSAGAGLGLYLTKKFVEAVGGSVSFKSSSSGTTFSVRLPVASA